MTEPFDKQALLEDIDGDFEFLEETLAMLDEDSGQLLDQVRTAAVAGDAAALVGPAHTLKGMVGNFCATRAQAAAREIEFMGREERLEAVGTAVENLVREVEQLRVSLHAFLEEQQP